MIELATYGICLAIVVVILFAVGVFSGSSFLLLFLLFPAIVSEALTGERGTFSPNGSGRKSSLFNLLMVSFSVIQVLLAAGILYGVHKLITGLTPTTKPVITRLVGIDPAEIPQLLVINQILLLLTGSFVVMLLFNTFRFRGQIRRMSTSAILVSYVLPLLLYPVGFFFLNSARNYLNIYPGRATSLESGVIASGIFYAIYLIASLLQQIYQYLVVFRRYQLRLDVQYWLITALGLVYKVLFIYFLIRILPTS